VRRRKAPRVPTQEILGEIEQKVNRCCRLPQTTLQPTIFVAIGVEQFGSTLHYKRTVYCGARIENSVATISRDQLKQRLPEGDFPLVETFTAVSYHH
jgi:hypothetical protein